MTKLSPDGKKEFVAVIKTRRKSKGGKRDGRHGHTGKVGIVYRLENGERKEEVFRAEGPTLKHVARLLRNPGPVPTWVRIDSEGETFF